MSATASCAPSTPSCSPWPSYFSPGQGRYGQPPGGVWARHRRRAARAWACGGGGRQGRAPPGWGCGRPGRGILEGAGALHGATGTLEGKAVAGPPLARRTAKAQGGHGMAREAGFSPRACAKPRGGGAGGARVDGAGVVEAGRRRLGATGQGKDRPMLRYQRGAPHPPARPGPAPGGAPPAPAWGTRTREIRGVAGRGARAPGGTVQGWNRPMLRHQRGASHATPGPARARAAPRPGPRGAPGRREIQGAAGRGAGAPGGRPGRLGGRARGEWRGARGPGRTRRRAAGGAGGAAGGAARRGVGGAGAGAGGPGGGGAGGGLGCGGGGCGARGQRPPGGCAGFGRPAQGSPGLPFWRAHPSTAPPRPPPPRSPGPGHGPGGLAVKLIEALRRAPQCSGI